MTTVTRTYTVPDISCDHCKRSTESAIGPLPHVEAVEVDIAAIAEAGYAIA
jgi:copper chaperone